MFGTSFAVGLERCVRRVGAQSRRVRHQQQSVCVIVNTGVNRSESEERTTNGVMGILDFMRDPRATTEGPALSEGLGEGDASFWLDLEALAASASNSRRNWSLFILFRRKAVGEGQDGREEASKRHQRLSFDRVRVTRRGAAIT